MCTGPLEPAPLSLPPALQAAISTPARAAEAAAVAGLRKERDLLGEGEDMADLRE
ncbi:hypothetical protein ALMP_25220 [Streptomyces sp. A012304]|nr:hypothetical protein ALMP_25220 [Streptomyces sp. A012304]